jgi:hypothetical protein
MQPTCLTCGIEIEEGETCCRSCLAKINRIATMPRAVEAMKNAIIDSMLLNLNDINEQTEALRAQLTHLKRVLGWPVC